MKISKCGSTGRLSDYHRCTLSFVEWMDFRLLEKFVMSFVLDFFFSFFGYQVKLPVASYLLETRCIDNFYLLRN